MAMVYGDSGYRGYKITMGGPHLPQWGYAKWNGLFRQLGPGLWETKQ